MDDYRAMDEGKLIQELDKLKAAKAHLQDQISALEAERADIDGKIKAVATVLQAKLRDLIAYEDASMKSAVAEVEKKRSRISPEQQKKNLQALVNAAKSLVKSSPQKSFRVSQLKAAAPEAWGNGLLWANQMKNPDEMKKWGHDVYIVRADGGHGAKGPGEADYKVAPIDAPATAASSPAVKRRPKKG